MTEPTQPSVRRLREFGIRPNRDLGQNFLVDSNILDVIGRAAELTAASSPRCATPSTRTPTRRCTWATRSSST